MRETQVKLSVIVIAHDRMEFIERALSSVRSQLGLSESPEVIVVTNLPEDWWQTLLRGYPCKPVRMAGSMSDKVLAGYRASTGDVVCFIEDDDEYAPGRLAKIETLFRTDPGLDYYHNAQTFIDAHSNRLSGGGIRAPCKVLETNSLDSREIYHLVNHSVDFNVGSMAVRRTLLESALQNLGASWFGSDTYLFYAGITLGRRLAIDPSPETRVRLHGGNLSSPTNGGLSSQRFYERRQVAATTLLTCYRTLTLAITAARPNHPALLTIDLQSHYIATFAEFDGFARRRRDIMPKVSWLFSPSYLLKRAYFSDALGRTLFWEVAAILSFVSPRLLLEAHALLVKMRWGL